MLRSMTAFGSHEKALSEGTLRWELKSVNHRYLSVNPRLPEVLGGIEPRVRDRITAALGRGRIDAVLTYRPSAPTELSVDWAYADELIAACRSLAARQDDAAAVSPLELLRMPGVMRESMPDVEGLADAAMSLLDEALAELVAEREREGQRLAAMIGERIQGVRDLVEVVRGRREAVIAGVTERLRARLASLDVEAETGRLEQELALAAQRLDIDEELSRLVSHCDAVSESLEADAPVGRRLDFLMQELNREANTVSSKSGDSETTRCAVDIKVRIEQMREQVQNIE